MEKDHINEDVGKAICAAMEDVKKGNFITFQYKKEVPDVKQLRSKLGMNRDDFAEAFNLSKYSIRNWELGTREPTGPALTLLQMIQSDPYGAYNLLHPED